MDNKLIIGSPPHVHTRETTARIMWMVTVSLVPAGIGAVVIFGLQALWLTLWSILAAVATEAVIQFLSKSKISIADGSAVLTGLLLAYNIPPNAPFWIPIAGSCFAIAIGKMVFGGLGQNIFNPALVGRAFLMASWPAAMTTFCAPLGKADAVTGATPLAALKEGKIVESLSYLDMLLGLRGGCIGEVCIIALLVGAVFLLIRGYISWHIPVSFIGSTALLMFIFGRQGAFTGDWLFHILNGGLLLGACFMATDYVTSPLTARGQIIFGIGCGVLTAVIRLWGGYPEGVSYAILMMNAATPLIDRYTRKRIYGT
ncbi:MAG TPA: RnfABCDGE type electron transport complex subunit D [Candidatus Omnitrophota bacterium]|nr:RnfABCDGE type electron transport complex subunit D [Candidatus Omnitrophota bacterium]